MTSTSTQNPMQMSASWPLVRRFAKTYVGQHLRRILIAVLLMMIAAAMTGSMAKLMEPIIDKVFTNKDEAMLWPIACAVFLTFAIRGVATYGHTVLINGLGQQVVSHVQRDMFAHQVYADLAYFHGLQSGQLLSRFTTDVALIRAAVTQSMIGFCKNSLTVTFLIGVMFWQDWKLSCVSILAFPAAAFAVSRMSKKLRKVATNMQMRTGDMTSLLGQAFQGNKLVKAYGMEEFEKKRVNAVIDQIMQLMCRSFKFSAVAGPLAETLSGLAIVTIIIYGGHQVIAGENTAGKFFSFITAFMLAFEPMKQLAKLNNVVQMGLAAIDRTFKMIDVPPNVQDKIGARALSVQNPALVFEDVHFVYADGTEALKGISFEVPAGKMVALVGESGAGKSTILSLIPRFYDVTSGAIRIGGQDIRDTTILSLRQNMALVSQEVAIFSDTVRDNIAYGKTGATEEEIIQAAKLAAAHDFILELPEGYNTRLGENGVKLSGGQRQRVSIARAMLRNAPILLLDEATSALDTTSERQVQTALERLQQGKTTIVVAHRLSTIMGADIIYVMSHGKIVESGNHASLMAKNGAYARLYGSLLKESA